MMSRIRIALTRTAPIVLALSALAVVAPPPAHAINAVAPAGFSTVSYNTGFGYYSLTNFAFLPNGSSMIAIAKCGYLVRVNLSADGSTSSVTQMGQLPNPSPGMGAGAFCQADRGLVGIDLANDYAVTGNFYLLYDYCKGGVGGPSVCNAPGQPTGKLSRFTVNNINAPTGLVANSEKVVLDDLPSYSSNTGVACDGSHTVGTVVVAPDNTLYVGNGEGSSYCEADWSALGAQDITSPRGKIFHINADGTGVDTNSFYQAAAPSSWQSRVFAYGFRNPFRFAIDPGTGNLMVGDVGWNTTEELDVVQKGSNYGWPCWEGNGKPAGYADLPTCVTLYANGGDQKPAYTWPHAGTGSAVVGGAFYTGGDYPTSYNGAFFFADYAKQWLATRSSAGTVSMFGSGDWGPTVAVHTGPNGDIFLASLVDSTIIRLRYTPVPNQFPIAHAQASVTAGQAPLAVTFTSTGSTDPDGSIQSYQWDFGDGSPVASGATVSHTYTVGSVFTAKLTVRDNANATSVDTISITTNNKPPVLTVQPLPAGVTYAVGDTVPVVASATDPDGGPTPTITYQQVLHHCPFPGSCHVHPGGASPAPGAGPYTCVISDHGDDTYLEVVITALDSGGASTTSSVVVPARKRTLAVSAAPGGVPIVVNASDSAATPSLTQVVGSRNHVTAPQSYGNLVFDHWSDGGARDHTFTMPDTNVNLVAFYKVAPVAPVPPPSAGGWTLNGAAAMSNGTLNLTPNSPSVAGSAVWPTAVATDGLRASFDATIDQGTGADGLTFALLDPSAGANALGGPAAALGFGTLPGVAVALDTFKGPVDPSDNFVGIATAGTNGQLVYVATTGAIPPLRNATHHVAVEVVGGHVKVTIDGAQVLDQAVAVPNQALLAFTAGTGGLTDRHAITNVSIQPPAPNLTVSPTSIDFGAVAVGGSVGRPVTVTNSGTAPLTIQALTTAGGPFGISGPAVGTVLGAGQSSSVTVTMAPPAGGAWTGSATIATSAGDATVLLSGSGPGSGAVALADSVFTPVQPYRLLDTRDAGLNPSARSALLTGGHELVLDLRGQPDAPPQPSAAMLNVTVTDPVAAGFLRAYPCGSTPTNSTVNFAQGQTAANLATVRIPGDGRVCFWSMVDTNLVIDVAGWYSAAGSPSATEPGVAYQTVEPVRVLDSRRADLAPGATPGKFQAFQEVAFSLAGKSGFPSDAHAALLNLTVTEPDGAGYLRVYPCGQEQTVSNVNFVAGQTVANFAAVKVATGGQVCFRSSTSAHVVVDLAGWYAPGPGALLAAPDPVRVLDTRDPALAPNGTVGPLPGGGQLAFHIAGNDGVPADASSVVLNVTATNTAADGYVAAYPCGTSPLVSNVNYRAGQVAAANLAVVKLPPDGRVCFTSFATTDLVIDLAGWYVG